MELKKRGASSRVFQLSFLINFLGGRENERGTRKLPIRRFPLFRSLSPQGNLWGKGVFPRIFVVFHTQAMGAKALDKR